MLGEEESALEADVHAAVPFLYSGVEHSLAHDDARVVDEDIDVAESLHHRFNGLLHIVLAGHVALECLRLSAEFADLTGFFGALVAHIDHCDRCAVLGVELGDGKADALTGAGDNGYLPFKGNELVLDHHGKLPP